MKALPLIVIALLLTGCAAPITRTMRHGAPADHAVYARDRTECLTANGYEPLDPMTQGIAASVLFVMGGLAYNPTFEPRPTNDNEFDSHLKVNRPAYACMEQRGYVLPF